MSLLNVTLNKTKTDNALQAGITTDDLHTVLEQVYLDYTNNYLTVENFANAYGITSEEATAIISAGKRGNKWA